jgi:N-formylglutamate deformylase
VSDTAAPAPAASIGAAARAHDPRHPTAPVQCLEPTTVPGPLVVDSPHSGFTWPAGWTTTASLEALRTTWDAHVHELWAHAPAVGATLVHATFPRAWIDPNRAEDDLDPALLAAPWPAPLAPTAYSARGMGLVRRFALPGVPMYEAPLPVAEVEARLATGWRPYREAVRAALDARGARFGRAWLLDVHSMKSTGNAMNVDAGAARPDLVVSDRHGTTADPAVTRWIAAWWRARGWRVQVNTPYQGGDLVATFGRPAEARHAVQLEINRARYLHEPTAERGAAFAEVQATCGAFLEAFVARIT